MNKKADIEKCKIAIDFYLRHYRWPITDVDIWQAQDLIDKLEKWKQK